ncbi:hypothetical protein N431DRAFT_178719 [Stipitochalara longipes BDJ]|nr:hypothetical protein N431DRAFT_178719 [Stipitochalara longipes BDJ]
MAPPTKTSKSKRRARPIRHKVYPPETLKARLDLFLLDPNPPWPPIHGAIRNGKGFFSRPPILVFPARRRVPGEQRPIRLADGASSTQPLRGSRRGSNHRESQTNTPSESVHELEDPTTLSDPSPRSGLPSTPESSTTHNVDKEKSNISSYVGSSKDSQLLSSAETIQKQQHIAANEVMTPTRLAHEPASCQSFIQQTQLPLNLFLAPQPSTQHIPSAIMLPNNMLWQPQDSLFSQGGQLPPPQFQPNPNQNTCFMAENSNSQFFYQPESSSRVVQAAFISEPNQTGHGLNSSPQDSNNNADSSIPSLTSASTSSQSQYSPYHPASDYSPRTPLDVIGEQDQQPSPHPEMPHMWQDESEMMFQEVYGEDNVVKDDSEWEDLVNYDAHLEGADGEQE